MKGSKVTFWTNCTFPLQFKVLCNDIQKAFRGEVVPTKAKKQQSIGINFSLKYVYRFWKWKKCLSKLFIKTSIQREVRAGKAYVNRMLLTFKTLIVIIYQNCFKTDNFVRCKAVFAEHNSIFCRTYYYDIYNSPLCLPKYLVNPNKNYIFMIKINFVIKIS